MFVRYMYHLCNNLSSLSWENAGFYCNLYHINAMNISRDKLFAAQ